MATYFALSQMGEEDVLAVQLTAATDDNEEEETEATPTVYGIIREELPCLSHFPT